MLITGVFFIPSNPNASTVLATVTERLHTALADEPIAVGRWALEHKLMRDTPSCLPSSTSQRQVQPRYMQFLSLTYYPTHGFIYTSPPPSQSPGGQNNSNNNNNNAAASTTPAIPVAAGAGVSTPGANSKASDNAANLSQPTVMSTVPLSSFGTLYQHFVYACQPFWCHRHTVTVPSGMVYDVGDFRVRIGDVRQTQPTARVRGTVVEIEWRGPSLVTTIMSQTNQASREEGEGIAGEGNGGTDDRDSGIDMSFSGIEFSDVGADYMATASLIREFWVRLGVEGAKEAILVPGVGTEVRDRLGKANQQQQGKRETYRGVDRGDSWVGLQDEDPDPDAGVDLARQYMEIFRFNR